MSSRVPPFEKRFRRMLTIADLLTGRKVVIPGEGICRVYGRHGENVLLKDPYRAASAVSAVGAPGNPLTKPSDSDTM